MLQHVISALPYPILVLDQRGRLRAYNTAAQGIFAQPQTGRHYVTLLRQPQVIAAVEAAFNSQKDQNVVVEQRLTTGLDRHFRVHIRVTDIADYPIIISFEDISPSENTNRMHRDFIANVSHELRTPLTAVSGFVETLLGPAQGDAQAQAHFLTLMQGEITRMQRLVQDLLSLSHIQSDTTALNKTVNLPAVIKDCHNSLAPLIGDIGFDVDIPPNLPSITGDRDQLHQVVLNCIENALKYGDGARVKITCKAHDHDPILRRPVVHLCVMDDGAGVDPALIPRLTERFYRLNTSHQPGTGLGLAIVEQITQRHGGRLVITNNPPGGLGGLSVEIILPLSVAD